jgi:hypothetical protein
MAISGQVQTAPPAPDAIQIEYPPLYDAADKASKSGQSRYSGLVRGDVLLLIAGALIGSVSTVGPARWQQALAVISGVTIASGILLRWVNKAQKPDQTWVHGRAIAEWLKANSWRYMIQVEPFDGEDRIADELFVNHLRERLRKNSRLSLAPDAPTSSQISEVMRLVRRQDFPYRRDVYIAKRLQDQVDWYSDRAKHHAVWAQRYFVAGVAAEAIALAWLLVRIALSTNLNLIGVFTSIAVAATALSQLYSHDELAQSYTVAQQDLQLTRTLMDTADKTSFRGLVIETEAAISAENSGWIIKRT